MVGYPSGGDFFNSNKTSIYLQKKSIISAFTISAIALVGVGLTGCAGSASVNIADATTGANKAATQVTQEAETNSDNSFENDNELYNVVDYIKSGKPFIFDHSYSDFHYDESRELSSVFVIKGDVIQIYGSSDKSHSDYITLEEYAKMSDEEAYEYFKENWDLDSEKPYVIYARSDYSGNNLKSLGIYFRGDSALSYSNEDIYYNLYGIPEEHKDLYTIQVYESTFLLSIYKIPGNLSTKSVFFAQIILANM